MGALFTCPACGKQLGARPGLEGQRRACPNCGEILIVPGHGKMPAPARGHSSSQLPAGKAEVVVAQPAKRNSPQTKPAAPPDQDQALRLQAAAGEQSGAAPKPTVGWWGVGEAISIFGAAVGLISLALPWFQGVRVWYEYSFLRQEWGFTIKGWELWPLVLLFCFAGFVALCWPRSLRHSWQRWVIGEMWGLTLLCSLAAFILPVIYWKRVGRWMDWGPGAYLSLASGGILLVGSFVSWLRVRRAAAARNPDPGTSTSK